MSNDHERHIASLTSALEDANRALRGKTDELSLSEAKYRSLVKDMTERTRLMEQITLAQKMESIGTLASGVAHDFNNILGIILPNAELIKMRTDPESACTRYADIIIKASRRAAELTKQLLSLSRKTPVAPRVIDLNDAVKATAKRLGETLDRNIHLEFDLTSECTKIKVDEAQVEQILLNLAINARNAMPEGGRLQFTTQCERANVIVRVSDTGTGIEPEALPKIFDPFFTTKDKSTGAGLGLSVVYGIVKRNGGWIDVKSEVGIGTEFILSFPSCNEIQTKPVRRTGKVRGGSEKILVADDEPDILRLLETSLTNLGYSVVCAKNGIEAVQRAEDDVQLIILDIMMPEMDGVAALQSIRQKMPNVKVLVSSGYTSPDKILLLEALGIEAFVQKPFELAKLAGAIRDVLDGVAV